MRVSLNIVYYWKPASMSTLILNVSLMMMFAITKEGSYASTKSAKCPITTQESAGPEKNALVKFSQCSQSTPTGPMSCMGATRTVTLVKGVTTDVG